MGVLTTSPRFAPAVGGPVVSDAFNRADSTTTLGTADTGQAWTALSGTWGISSNQAYCVDANDGRVAAIETGSTDQTVTVTATIPNSSSYPGVLARLTDADNFYLAQINTGSTTIYRNSAGYSLLGTGSGAASGDVLEFSVIGTSLNLDVNGGSVISLTNSGITSGSLAGIRYATSSGSPAIRWDDFSVVA